MLRSVPRALAAGIFLWLAGCGYIATAVGLTRGGGGGGSGTTTNVALTSSISGEIVDVPRPSPKRSTVDVIDYAHALAVVDLDRDGDAEIITVNRRTHNLTILSGDGVRYPRFLRAAGRAVAGRPGELDPPASSPPPP